MVAGCPFATAKLVCARRGRTQTSELNPCFFNVSWIYFLWSHALCLIGEGCKQQFCVINTRRVPPSLGRGNLHTSTADVAAFAEATTMCAGRARSRTSCVSAVSMTQRKTRYSQPLDGHSGCRAVDSVRLCVRDREFYEQITTASRSLAVQASLSYSQLFPHARN